MAGTSGGGSGAPPKPVALPLIKIGALSYFGPNPKPNYISTGGMDTGDWDDTKQVVIRPHPPAPQAQPAAVTASPTNAKAVTSPAAAASATPSAAATNKPPQPALAPLNEEDKKEESGGDADAKDGAAAAADAAPAKPDTAAERRAKAAADAAEAAEKKRKADADAKAEAEAKAEADAKARRERELDVERQLKVEAAAAAEAKENESKLAAAENSAAVAAAANARNRLNAMNDKQLEAALGGNKYLSGMIRKLRDVKLDDSSALERLCTSLKTSSHNAESRRMFVEFGVLEMMALVLSSPTSNSAVNIEIRILAMEFVQLYANDVNFRVVAGIDKGYLRVLMDILAPNAKSRLNRERERTAARHMRDNRKRIDRDRKRNAARVKNKAARREQRILKARLAKEAAAAGGRDHKQQPAAGGVDDDAMDVDVAAAAADVADDDPALAAAEEAEAAAEEFARIRDERDPLDDDSDDDDATTAVKLANTPPPQPPPAGSDPAVVAAAAAAAATAALAAKRQAELDKENSKKEVWQHRVLTVNVFAAFLRAEANRVHLLHSADLQHFFFMMFELLTIQSRVHPALAGAIRQTTFEGLCAIVEHPTGARVFASSVAVRPFLKLDDTEQWAKLLSILLSQPLIHGELLRGRNLRIVFRKLQNANLLLNQIVENLMIADQKSQLNAGLEAAAAAAAPDGGAAGAEVDDDGLTRADRDARTRKILVERYNFAIQRNVLLLRNLTYLVTSDVGLRSFVALPDNLRVTVWEILFSQSRHTEVDVSFHALTLLSKITTSLAAHSSTAAGTATAVIPAVPAVAGAVGSTVVVAAAAAAVVTAPTAAVTSTGGAAVAPIPAVIGATTPPRGACDALIQILSNQTNAPLTPQQLNGGDTSLAPVGGGANATAVWMARDALVLMTPLIVRLQSFTVDQSSRVLGFFVGRFKLAIGAIATAAGSSGPAVVPLNDRFGAAMLTVFTHCLTLHGRHVYAYILPTLIELLAIPTVTIQTKRAVTATLLQIISPYGNALRPPAAGVAAGVGRGSIVAGGGGGALVGGAGGELEDIQRMGYAGTLCLRYGIVRTYVSAFFSFATPKLKAKIRADARAATGSAAATGGAAAVARPSQAHPFAADSSGDEKQAPKANSSASSSGAANSDSGGFVNVPITLSTLSWHTELIDLLVLLLTLDRNLKITEKLATSGNSGSSMPLFSPTLVALLLSASVRFRKLIEWRRHVPAIVQVLRYNQFCVLDVLRTMCTANTACYSVLQYQSSSSHPAHLSISFLQDVALTVVDSFAHVRSARDMENSLFFLTALSSSSTFAKSLSASAAGKPNAGPTGGNAVLSVFQNEFSCWQLLRAGNHLLREFSYSKENRAWYWSDPTATFWSILGPYSRLVYRTLLMIDVGGGHLFRSDPEQSVTTHVQLACELILSTLIGVSNAQTKSNAIQQMQARVNVNWDGILSLAAIVWTLSIHSSYAQICYQSKYLYHLLLITHMQSHAAAAVAALGGGGGVRVPIAGVAPTPTGLTPASNKLKSAFSFTPLSTVGMSADAVKVPIFDTPPPPELGVCASGALFAALSVPAIRMLMLHDFPLLQQIYSSVLLYISYPALLSHAPPPAAMGSPAGMNRPAFGAAPFNADEKYRPAPSPVAGDFKGSGAGELTRAASIAITVSPPTGGRSGARGFDSKVDDPLAPASLGGALKPSGAAITPSGASAAGALSILPRHLSLIEGARTLPTVVDESTAVATGAITPINHPAHNIHAVTLLTLISIIERLVTVANPMSVTAEETELVDRCRSLFRQLIPGCWQHLRLVGTPESLYVCTPGVKRGWFHLLSLFRPVAVPDALHDARDRLVRIDRSTGKADAAGAGVISKRTQNAIKQSRAVRHSLLVAATAVDSKSNAALPSASNATSRLDLNEWANIEYAKLILANGGGGDVAINIPVTAAAGTAASGVAAAEDSTASKSRSLSSAANAVSSVSGADVAFVPLLMPSASPAAALPVRTVSFASHPESVTPPSNA